MESSILESNGAFMRLRMQAAFRGDLICLRGGVRVHGLLNMCRELAHTKVLPRRAVYSSAEFTVARKTLGGWIQSKQSNRGVAASLTFSQARSSQNGRVLKNHKIAIVRVR